MPALQELVYHGHVTPSFIVTPFHVNNTDVDCHSFTSLRLLLLPPSPRTSLLLTSTHAMPAIFTTRSYARPAAIDEGFSKVAGSVQVAQVRYICYSEQVQV